MDCWDEDDDEWKPEFGCGCAVLMFSAFVILSILWEAWKYTR